MVLVVTIGAGALFGMVGLTLAAPLTSAAVHIINELRGRAEPAPRLPRRRWGEGRGPSRVDRQRVARTLTFWLRPEFVLRVVNRFQKVAGFDRAIALASGALTAMIPLVIVTSAIATHVGGKDTAERIIDRYKLTGGGARRCATSSRRRRARARASASSGSCSCWSRS